MSENTPKTGKRPAPKTAFVKGQSGNPGGRPKKTPEQFELEAACKAKTPDALAVIESIMLNGENERNRLAAAQAIIERAYGRPVERKEVKTGLLEDIPHEQKLEAFEAIQAEIERRKSAGERIH